MDIFISWSGNVSLAVAQSYKFFIKKMIPEAKLFISNDDIEKGSDWHQTLRERLESCNYGIVVVTADNYEKSWLLYETGALSKAVGRSRVIPALYNISKSAVGQPLGAFQAFDVSSEDDAWKTICTLNTDCTVFQKAPDELKDDFAVWWPKLQTRMTEALTLAEEDEASKRQLSPEEIANETLKIVKNAEKTISDTREDSNQNHCFLDSKMEDMSKEILSELQELRHELSDVGDRYAHSQVAPKSIENTRKIQSFVSELKAAHDAAILQLEARRHAVALDSLKNSTGHFEGLVSFIEGLIAASSTTPQSEYRISRVEKASREPKAHFDPFAAKRK